jgi:hypothetical protein
LQSARSECVLEAAAVDGSTLVADPALEGAVDIALASIGPTTATMARTASSTSPSDARQLAQRALGGAALGVVHADRVEATDPSLSIGIGDLIERSLDSAII